MSLQLKSEYPELQSFIDKVEMDGLVTPAEFSKGRDRADAEAVNISDESLHGSCKAFMGKADELAEELQQIALAARKAKLGVSDKDTQKNAEKEKLKEALKKTIEFQLAYIVLAYRSSLERL